MTSRWKRLSCLSAIITPISIAVMAAAEYSLKVNFDCDRFEASSIEAMLDHFIRLLESVVADPTGRLSDFPILSNETRQQLLSGWNHTQTTYEQPRTIDGLFFDRATRTPDSMALCYENDAMEITHSAMISYGALATMTNHLAGALKQRGVGLGVTVGIYSERGPEVILAMLAILRAGAAYLPLETELPPRSHRLHAR